MQQRAMIWILGAFHTLSAMGIEVITRLIPIIYHLHKLSCRNQLCITILSHNHRLKEFLERRFAPLSPQHGFSLENMTTKQQMKIKSSIVNINNCLNGIFLSFNKLVDSFSNCFFTASSDPATVIVVFDTSIKNNVATSIVYIYSFNNPLNKMLYYAINVALTLFAIRYRINQAIQIPDISCIIIITNTLHVVDTSP